MFHLRVAGIRTCSLVLLVVLSITVAVRADAEDPNDPAVLTLDRIFTGEEFEFESFGPARWLKDGSGYTTVEKSETCDDGKDIVRYDPQTGDREILVSAERLTAPGESKPLEIDNYIWSPDGKKLLVFTNTKRVWRENTRGDYWVLDLDSGDLKKLGGDAEESTLMFAKFAPTGDRVAYVCKRNIYVQDLESMRTKKLTTDGSDRIVNGTSDWVYEEEFRLRDGFRWSPDGRFIAYWQFDTAGVEEFVLINYTDSLYPKLTRIQYPKVGRKNSACRVGVVGAGGGATRWFAVKGDARNNYIPRMDWVGDTNKIVIQQLNRLQNTNNVMVSCVDKDMLGQVRPSRPRVMIVERDDAWVDVHNDLKWLGGAASFIWTSQRDGWRHIYRIHPDGGKTQLLTPGDFDVISVESIDEADGWVYYIASPENPTQRYLYRSALDAGGMTQRVTPLDQAGTHSYDISADAKWAFHTYSAFDKPAVIDLVRMPGHERVRVLEDNSAYRAKIAALNRPACEFFRVDIGDGVELDGWCVKPPDFDPQKKYPLLIYVYGEPAGQTVLDKWTGKNEKQLWHWMLAQQGYIVASVDNRGTPAPRGRQWRKCVYRQIGILASADQAAAVRQLIKKWTFVDPERIGVWGWSGGGSMTLNAMFRYPDLYRTGIAVAFIANQRYYDTIYQERYMGLPDDNEEGFRDGSPITFAKQLEGNLLIVYGTGDDNCHYQNCLALTNELIKHNKYFSMMSYPNRTHAIKEGDNTRRHLYGTMTTYLGKNLPAGTRPNAKL
ncbi:MAG: S9 family peptidase [Planctomycetes bacterium]|nr:S9 family peptidase [Planctomycetota bacterium]